MKPTLKPIIALFLFIFFTQLSFANGTNEEIFSKALKAYDKVSDNYEKLFGNNDDTKNENADKESGLTIEKYKEFKKLLDNTDELFDQYVRISKNSTNIKVARYFRLSIKEMDFVSMNHLGQFSANYKRISDLSKDLSVIKGFYYPIKYSSNGKKYIITSKAKTNLERHLTIQFAKASSLSGHPADATKWAKKAYAFYNLGDYNLWWCAHIWYYNNNRQGKNNADMVESAEKLIYSASGLTRSKIKLLVDSNYANHTHAYYRLNSLLKSKPELSRGGEVWAKAAENYEKLNKDAWAMEYYNKALAAGYGDKTFLLKMMSKGKKESNKQLVKTAAETFDSKNLYTVSYNCTEYKTIAEYFDYVNQESKANELKEKYKSCDKALTKEQRRRARGGKFYVSIAPFAPLSGNLQGSIQLGGNKRLHEFGIKQTNSQRDYGFDNFDSNNPEEFKWSGLSYYYGYKKFFSRSSDGDFYFGFQFRYTDRVYETQKGVRYKTNGSSSTNITSFNPTETRYDFTLQPGYIYSSRFFHLEYYAGFGLGYSIFDGGGAEWNNDNIEITNHNILANRGETRIGATFRFGLVIGFNFINK